VQARRLEQVWPVIFLDAIICKVRDADTVRNKAAHLAVGLDLDGKKEVLGTWVEHTEGAKFWLRVMNDLKARGIEDVLIVVCDGLVPAAVEAVWPQAVVQTCIVHLIRASLRWVNYKDRKRVAAQLRQIYAPRPRRPPATPSTPGPTPTLAASIRPSSDSGKPHGSR
jgi:putative transposase